MKEQNNIEGTVDKTSLKCKGVWFFILFWRFFFLLNVTTVARPPSNRPSPFTPETSLSLSLSLFLLSPPGSYLLYITARFPHSLLHPSVDPLTRSFSHLNENNSLVLTFPEFLFPLSLHWEIWDQLLCTILADNKTVSSRPANTFYTQPPAGTEESH